MEVYLITGVSGAGKSTVIYALEEMGFYIVENLPPQLVERMYESAKEDQKKYAHLALTVKIDDALAFVNFFRSKEDVTLKFIGLDCSRSVLHERFKLTRRLHPRQAMGLTLNQAIDVDKAIFDQIRSEVDFLVDTSKLQGSELRRYIYQVIDANRKNIMCVSFISFGFKKGVPQDVEVVFDTRNVPNPFWIPELKELSGLDQPVVDYVLDKPATKELLKHIIDYLDYFIAEAEKSGRNLLAVGIGCTGGRHRSVAIAEYLKHYYSKEYKTMSFHKDLQ